MSSEAFKASVHLGIFGLTTAALLYNLGEYRARRQWHHGANVITYTALCGYEILQVLKHVK